MKYLRKTASLQFTAEKCTGCGRCAEVCPHEVFIMDNGRARVTDIDLCMECGACMKNCDYGAISVTAGVGCAAALLHAMRTGGEPVCDCGTGSSGAACCG
jgi:NAD-dependent dihydropyrimidine dehydrogenase PreA subunit